MTPSQYTLRNISFLNGGGEMAALTRNFNWAATTLGEPAGWPQSLKTTLSILLNSRFPMFLFWGDAHICFYNDAYRPSLGINGKHPAVGKQGEEIWPEIWRDIKPLIDTVLSGGEASWNEDLLLPIYRNGQLEDVYWTFSYSPVTDETGRTAGVFVTCTETTEKVKLINKLRTAENRFQNLVREATIGIVVLLGDEMIVGAVNERCSRLVGRSVHELADKPLFNVIPEAEAFFRPILDKVRSTGEPFYLDEQTYTVNGGSGEISGFLNLVYQPYKEADGTITGVIVLCHDVTEQVNSRLKTQDAEERARLAIEAAGVGIYDVDLQTGKIITSPRLDEIMGITGSAHHAAYFSALHPDDLPVRKAAYDTAYNTGVLKYQARIINGEQVRWIQAEGSLVKDSQGRPLRVLGTMLDITEQVNARDNINNANAELGAANEELAATNEELAATNEELSTSQLQLQQQVEEAELSRAKFRALINSSPVAMLVHRGDDLVIEEVNEAMLQLIDKDASVKGMALYEALPELKGQPIMDIVYHTYRTGEQSKMMEAPVTLNRNGEPYQGFYNVTYTAIKEAGKITGLMQSAVDVTTQVIARNEIEQALEQARLSKEAAQLGTFDMDMLKGTMHWDARCRQLFGINHTGDVTYEKDFVTGLHPDDRERIVNIINDVFVRSKTNGVYDVEYRTVGADDQKMRWVRAKGQVYFDKKDRPLRFIGSVLDITEQKLDELRKNDFIGMVSHELKTPLTSLTAILQVLNSKFKLSEDQFIGSSLERANIQVKKMSTMINGFLNLSRLESGKLQMEKTDFDMEELIGTTINETRFTAPAHHFLFEPCGNFQVHADKDKISSVISNLLSNAVKYSPKGRDVVVNCIKETGAVRVSITDHGIGIAEHDIAPLFDRYYRVENPNYKHISGFGIGLYLSAEIIRSHGGEIGVESTLGEGSSFYFRLPLS